MTIANMICALALIDEVTERAAANTGEMRRPPVGQDGFPVPEIAIRGAGALFALHHWEFLHHDQRGLTQAFRELEPEGSVPWPVFRCTALAACAAGRGKADLTLVQRAMLAAATAHEGQVLQSGNVPYIAHPLAVAMHLALAGYGRDCTAAALVHDVIANTEWDERMLAAELGEGAERCLPLVRFATELSMDVSLHDRKVTETKLAEAPRVGLALVIADESHNLRHARPEQTWFVEALIEAIQGESGEPFDSYVDIVEAARSSD